MASQPQDAPTSSRFFDSSVGPSIGGAGTSSVGPRDADQGSGEDGVHGRAVPVQPHVSVRHHQMDGLSSDVQGCRGLGSSLYPNGSEYLHPTNIMDEYIAQQNVIDSIVKQLIASIKSSLENGCAHRRSGPRTYIQRDHEGAHERLVADYFAEDPLYPARMFRTRFRMRIHLFLRIVSALGDWSPYFTQRADCLNRQGLSPLQKCTAAIRMLAYSTPADALDEYLKD